MERVLTSAGLPPNGVVCILPGAMTADAATVAPTKRGRWAWLIGVVAVVAVIAIVLPVTPPKPELVKVWFVRATNEAGVKKLVFEGTNGMAREIHVFTCVVPGKVDPANPWAAASAFLGIQPMHVAERTSFAFSLVPSSDDAPYRVAWWFVDVHFRETRLGRLRAECCEFFKAHGMPRVGDRFLKASELHAIPSTEIKE